MDNHSIKSAMDRGELTEEEAYFVLRFAGHLGYDNAMKRLKDPLKVLRRKLIHFQGWEPPELMQWDSGYPPFIPFRVYDNRLKWKDPSPLNLLNRITMFRIEPENYFIPEWIDIRLMNGYLCINLKSKCIYWSPDATPQNPRAVCIVNLNNDRNYPPFRQNG